MKTLLKKIDIVKSITILALIISFSFNSFAQQKLKEITNGKKIVLKSEILGEDRTILISLPDGYENSNKKFPVLYVLDGRTHFTQATGATDYLARQRLAPQIIIVAITNIDRNRDFTPIHSKQMQTSGGGKEFHNFIEKELMPHIKKTYRTSTYNILMGHSLGGMFAAYSLLEFPGIFDSYIVVSPYLQCADNYINKLAKTKLKPNYKKTPSFYMTVGNEPDYFKSLDEFSSLIKEKTDNAINFLYVEMQGDNHTTTPYLSLFNGLRFTFSDWMLSKETITKGLSAIDEHYKQVSKKFNIKISTPENTINILGYRHLRANETDKAIEDFKENVKRFPNSANVYDSLGEAYEKDNQLKLAKENYKKAFKLGLKQNHQATQIYKKNLDRISASVNK